MHFLFLFLDGVGLGEMDAENNPFAQANMPFLESLIGGRKLVREAAPFVGPRATLLGLDATLGVRGIPQSATGQAVLVTGRNVPAEIGLHFGPKPNSAIRSILQNGNIFTTLHDAGRSAALLNAYPDRYFAGIASGRRMYSAIPMAVTSGGYPLKTEADFFNGFGMSADFTGQAWRDHLDRPEAPVLSPRDAGRRLALLAGQVDFAFFEYWITDYLGHHQDMPGAVQTLERFDEVLSALVEAWAEDEGLILLTSDHGNMEDLSTKRHTKNLVPGLVIGARELRREFTRGLRDLTGVAPAILAFLGV